MMKPNRKTRHTMSTDFVHHQKSTARCVAVLSPLIRHLNSGTLAIAMFVAFALLSTSRGKEIETRGSRFTEVTKKSEEVRSSVSETQATNLLPKNAGIKAHRIGTDR